MDDELRPRTDGLTLVWGFAFTLLVHGVPLGIYALRDFLPELDSTASEEAPIVARPYVAATLLKLGAPIDPRKLPDRLIPHQRTAPKQEIVASREEPLSKSVDAGLPPLPAAHESDVVMNVQKNEPFAENKGKVRPEEGHAQGVEAGTELDPSKVHAGDTYAAVLGQWFHNRWEIPTVISQGEANRLCVTFRVNLNPHMVVWHVRQEPIRTSGNDLFDDSARSMLMKILDDRTPLPEPPADVADRYRGRSIDFMLSGDLHGDSSKCR